MRSSVLCRNVDYSRVLNELNVSPQSAALPTRVDCPVCGRSKSLLVMTDTATSGQWTYCRSCHFAGDMILLAAAAWKLELRDAIRTIGERHACGLAFCTDAAISTYAKIFADPYRRIKEFVAKLAKRHVHADNQKLRSLQALYGVSGAGPNWQGTVSQFVGVCTRQEYDVMIQQDSDTTMETKQQQRIRSTLTADWTDMLIVPFWDVPGRISGILIIGRDGKPEKDVMYKRLFREVTEPGLAMFPAILQGKHPIFQHTKFVFTDVAPAMRLHTKHTRENENILPLAATWSDPRYPGANIWNTFTHKDIVFWGLDRVEAIKHARLAKGTVSLFTVIPDPYGSYFRNSTAIEWLSKIKNAAVPWHIALHEILLDAADDNVGEILSHVGLAGKDLSMFVEDCPIVLRDRLRVLTENQVYESRVRFKKVWVCERADGWYVEQTNERICGAVIRIHQTVTGVSDTFYHGIIRFRGVEYPFTAPVSQIEKGLLSWAQQYLRDVCQAGLCEFHPEWNKTALQLAITFYSPRSSIGINNFGWDPNNRRFNFPNFSIEVGGNITTDIPKTVGKISMPGLYAKTPGVFTREQLQLLSATNPETLVFWATTACIVSNMLARAVNKNQRPLMLCGDGAKCLGIDTAAKHGCINLTDFSRTQFPHRLSVPEWIENWPVIIRTPVPTANVEWFDDPCLKHFVLAVPVLTAYTQLMRGIGNVVRYDRNIGSLQTIRTVAEMVLPSYIQHAFQHRLMKYDYHADFTFEILHDISCWFTQLGGDATVIRNARGLISTPDSQLCTKYFADSVFELHRRNLLPLAKYGFWNSVKSPGIMPLPDNAGIWISQERYREAMFDEGMINPPMMHISNELISRGVLKCEKPMFGDTGWLLDTDWWHTAFDTWRSNAGGNKGQHS